MAKKGKRVCDKANPLFCIFETEPKAQPIADHVLIRKLESALRLMENRVIKKIRVRTPFKLLELSTSEE
jgi:hypothetical protein